MTPAPEEAKGMMYVAGEEFVKVEAKKVYVLAKNGLIGKVASPVEVDCTFNGQTFKRQLKDCVVFVPESMDLKGYSEVVVDEVPLRIGIEGTNVITKKNVSGYYLIHKDDLKVLLKNANK